MPPLPPAPVRRELRPWPFCAWVLAIVVLGSSAQAAAVHRLQVVTSSTVLQDILIHVGGDRIDARCLLRPGTDPHTYQPVPGDVRRISAADMIIMNGLGFEPWLPRLLRDQGYHGILVTASDGINPLVMADEDHAGHGVPDPHAFNDLANGMIYARNICDALVAADPGDADDFRAWTAQYLAQLRQLDAWVKTTLAVIPPAQRVLVTDHDALQYFAKAYGFTILSPTNAIEDAQASAHTVGDIVTAIRTHHLRGVFFEHGKNPALMEQIARETGIRNGGDLYLDGTGAAGTLAGGYEGMFLCNVRTIFRAMR